jgi:hypothetical protein
MPVIAASEPQSISIMASKYNVLPFCKGFGLMNWVFHYESWHSAIGSMDKDRPYDLTAFPPGPAP